MRLIFLFCLLFFLGGCVSKKKHISMLANQELKLETQRRGELSKLSRKIQMLQDSIRKSEIVSAAQSGSIGTLESLRKELGEKNKALEDQIEQLKSQSASNTQSLSGQLKEKDDEIAGLKATIANVQQTLNQEEISFGTLVGDLRAAIGFADPNKYEIISSKEAVVLQLNEQLLFNKGSVSKLSSDGRELIGQLAKVIERFPAVKMEVTGHTDNNKPKTGYSDNWTVSVIRAVAVTKQLVNENGISAGQVVASGKGEYAPKSSNIDKDGQAKNRRVELIFKAAEDNIVQKIRKITG